MTKGAHTLHSVLLSMLADSPAGWFKMQFFREWVLSLKMPLSCLGCPMWPFSWTVWVSWGFLLIQRTSPKWEALTASPLQWHYCPQVPCPHCRVSGKVARVHTNPQFSSRRERWQMAVMLDLSNWPPVTKVSHRTKSMISDALWKSPNARKALPNLPSIKIAKPWMDCSSMLLGT